MSSHSHHSSESDRESIKSLLKQLAQDIQSLSYRQLQYETQLKEREKSKKSSHASSSRGDESFGEQNLRIKDYYQRPPRRARRERQERTKEVRVDLPYFHGKENVDTYLDWEMKVEQLFVCHRVSEER